MPALNATHDPAQRSWLPSANTPDTDFPIQNLPFGIGAVDGQRPHPVVAIGDRAVDLAVLAEAGLLATAPPQVLAQPVLNPFIALGPEVWRATRARLFELLRADCPLLRDHPSARARALISRSDLSIRMPLDVPGYTDFYSSREHATNVGSMFRDPKNALLPNWLEIPIGYNGRASSVVVSGTPIRRPNGQLKAPDAPRPTFAPCRKLDIELETAFVVGRGNALGTPIAVGDAEAHIFGMVLLNDWSARDIQTWEYVPLGPFNSKTFATSISPWLVTLDALEPFRVPGPEQSPSPLAYLQQHGAHAFDVRLEVRLRPQGAAAMATICRTNLRHLYWSMAQQLAHHTSGGCNARVGDLMASGTISGPTPDSFGSLLELTWNGRDPVPVPGGTRTFLEDGDEVVISGWCEGDGYRVGFGEVCGTILPALPG